MDDISKDTLLPDDFLPLLDELNRIVVQSGVPMEGNLFYYHHQPSPDRDNIADFFYIKRRNFAAVSKAGSRMLEIGFNAGHSALLALSRGVELHCVDICMHPYTKPAAQFLKQRFGERFHFYEGDSLIVLPKLRRERPDLRFDLLHIDGNHGTDYCRADTLNALEMALPDAWLVLDDTDMAGIRAFYEQELCSGLIDRSMPEGWVPSPHHAVGRFCQMAVQPDYY